MLCFMFLLKNKLIIAFENVLNIGKNVSQILKDFLHVLCLMFFIYHSASNLKCCVKKKITQEFRLWKEVRKRYVHLVLRNIYLSI